jgi:hypothetical protein
MAVFALLSAGGSPGVTTAALALTLSWPTQVVIAECDPSGGDILAGLLSGHLPATAGLLPLALEAGAGAEVPADILWRQLVELDEEHNRLLLAGISDPRQSAALQSSLPWIADALQGLRADVLADCGRLDAVAAVRPVLSAASLAILVLQPTLRQVSRAIPRVEMLTNLMGPGRVVLVTVGDGATSGRELAKTLGVPVAGHLPADPKTAGVLSDGIGGRRRLSERPLIRAAAAVGRGIRAAAESAGAQPGVAPAVYASYEPESPALDGYLTEPAGLDENPAGGPAQGRIPAAAADPAGYPPARPRLNGFPAAPKGPGSRASETAAAEGRRPQPPPGPGSYSPGSFPPEFPDPDPYPGSEPGPDAYAPEFPGSGLFQGTRPEPDADLAESSGAGLDQDAGHRADADAPEFSTPDRYAAGLPEPDAYPPEFPIPDRYAAGPPEPDAYPPEFPIPDRYAASPPEPDAYPPEPPDPGRYPETGPEPDAYAPEFPGSGRYPAGRPGSGGYPPEPAGPGRYPAPPPSGPYDPDPLAPFPRITEYAERSGWDPADAGWPALMPYDPGPSATYDPSPSYDPRPAYDPGPAADPSPVSSRPPWELPGAPDDEGVRRGQFRAGQPGAGPHRVFGAGQHRAVPAEPADPGDPDGTQYGPAQNGSRP